jgi:ABC-type phosphate/phosphonate transport system substrate-binding protein
MNARLNGQPNGSRCLPKWAWCLWLLTAMVPMLRGVARAADPASARTEIRFGFSRAMFADVNQNDARAAMKVYTLTIGDQNGIYVGNEPILLEGTNEIAEAVLGGRAEVFALTAEEFLTLESLGFEGPFLCSNIRSAFTEDYLVISRADGPVSKVEDLKGHGLIVQNDARGSLAQYWLEVLCHEHGLGHAADATSKMTFSPKVTQVVLPVFFGKSDACVVTRNGWEVMAELNPQLRKELRVIAASPPVLPAMTCFGRNVSEPMKAKILKAVELSSTKPSYRQLMTLFKSDGVGPQPVSRLETTRALMAGYRKLCGVPLNADNGP